MGRPGSWLEVWPCCHQQGCHLKGEYLMTLGPGRSTPGWEVALPGLVGLVVLTVSVVVEAVAAETKDALDFLGYLTLYLKRQQGPNRDSLLGGVKR